jgi:hypothetical protein
MNFSFIDYVRRCMIASLLVIHYLFSILIISTTLKVSGIQLKVLPRRFMMILENELYQVATTKTDSNLVSISSKLNEVRVPAKAEFTSSYW